MKLHLGCGQNYFEGYVNIDFPPSEHTVQDKVVADKHADLTKLRYKAKSIDEVRLHHVFEHFIRPQALALLASWHSWLKMGGRMHIEVPDFDATAKLVLGRFTNNRDRKVALRHIFGSNEAPWATHYEGWSRKHLVEVLNRFGFRIESTDKSAYLATRNITVLATKSSDTPSQTKLIETAKSYLRDFTVDEKAEAALLEVWLEQFKTQLAKTIAR